MSANRATRTGIAGGGDFDRTAERRDPPERRSRPVAKDRSGAARQHRRHPASLSRNGLVPNCVDATVKSMKAPQAQSSVDRVFSQPHHRNQLPTRNHSMLPASDIRNRRIQSVSLQFPAYMAGKCRLDGHPPTVADLGARVVRTGARMCDDYGPGVRSTAASAVAASASRIAAPSRALDRART